MLTDVCHKSVAKIIFERHTYNIEKETETAKTDILGFKCVCVLERERGGGG